MSLMFVLWFIVAISSTSLNHDKNKSKTGCRCYGNFKPTEDYCGYEIKKIAKQVNKHPDCNDQQMYYCLAEGDLVSPRFKCNINSESHTCNRTKSRTGVICFDELGRIAYNN